MQSIAAINILPMIGNGRDNLELKLSGYSFVYPTKRVLYMMLAKPVYIYRNTWETSRNYYSRVRDSQFYQIPYPPHIRDDSKPGEYYELVDEVNNIYEHSFYKQHIKGTVIRYGIYQHILTDLLRQVQMDEVNPSGYDGKTGQILQVLGTGKYNKGILKSYVKNIQVASNLYNTLGMMPKELTSMISDYTQNDRLKNYHEIDLTELLADNSDKFEALLHIVMSIMMGIIYQPTAIGSLVGISQNKRVIYDISKRDDYMHMDSDDSENKPALPKMTNIEYRLNHAHDMYREM